MPRCQKAACMAPGQRRKGHWREGERASERSTPPGSDACLTTIRLRSERSERRRLKRRRSSRQADEALDATRAFSCPLSRYPAPAAANELPEDLAFLRQGCSRDPAPAAELSDGLLQIQELQFSVEAGGVACEADVRADYPVTGNDDRDGIVGNCIAHSLG